MKVIYGKRLVDLHQSHLDLDLKSMARSLSRIFRWGGHSPITVAQHSVMASYLSANYPREALLHDASEALIGDITTPVKQYFSAISGFETGLLERIFTSFGLRWPLPDEVKRIDARLVGTEGEQFFGLRSIDPYPLGIKPWSCTQARKRFIERAQELNIVSCSQKANGKAALLL